VGPPARAASPRVRGPPSLGGRAAALGGIAALLAVGVVWLFSRGDFTAFAWSTLGYYSSVLQDFVASRSYPPGELSITPWLGEALGAPGIRAVNAAAQVVVLLFAVIALTSLPRLFALLAASLLLMTVTNVVSWTYQYLLPGALLWLGLMAAPSDRSPRDAGPASEPGPVRLPLATAHGPAPAPSGPDPARAGPTGRPGAFI
jgi:hypothetical protein